MGIVFAKSDSKNKAKAVKMNQKKSSSTKITLRKKKDLPATCGMLDEFRAEWRESHFRLEARFDGVDAKFNSIDARFDSIDARFAEIDARFDSIDARFAEIDARFAGIDARFTEIDAKFAGIDARFAEIDARFDRLEAKIDEKFAEILAVVHRTLAIVEEQKSENRIMYEHLQGLTQRVDHVELRQNSTDEILRELVRSNATRRNS